MGFRASACLPRRNIVSGIILSFCCLLFACLLSLPAQAACRDDCHSDCCGDNGLCQSEDQLSCLVDCLKGCGGDDIPPVPEPEPVEPDTNSSS